MKFLSVFCNQSMGQKSKLHSIRPIKSKWVETVHFLILSYFFLFLDFSLANDASLYYNYESYSRLKPKEIPWNSSIPSLYL